MKSISVIVQAILFYEWEQKMACVKCEEGMEKKAVGNFKPQKN
jgi:hypothetical protein